MLHKDTKIYVAGHRGLVGSAIWKNLQTRGYHNLVGRTHSELDLTNQAQVRAFFDEEQPEARGIGRCTCGRHHGQLAISGRLHHAEHADAMQRN